LEIISPIADWNYSTEDKIEFSCNIKNSDLVWESSIDGVLGRGFDFSKKLSNGIHEISVKDSSANKSVSTYINVVNKNKKEKCSLLTELPYTYFLDAGTDFFSVFSLDGKVSDLTLTDGINKLENIMNNSFMIKDFSLSSCDINLKPVNSYINYSRMAIPYEKQKMFYVINTNDVTSKAHEINASLYYTGKYINVYIPDSYTGDLSLIESCIQKIDSCVVKKVNQLWGQCADVNGDEAISILFTNTINEEKVAIGFFNSRDFYEQNTDFNSSSYNPYSNEMDILYVAMPDETDINYSINSIIATVAHEYTHAINYSVKTWNRFIKEDLYVDEEIFLDEGWSHLTESLCGYGQSGGNQDFVNYYLNNSCLYSFCKNDYLGRNDSAGQRGAVTLFLYWLFVKAGGVEQTGDGLSFINNGGIDFLKTMNSSYQTGWECIGEFFDKTTDSLFLDFCKELISGEIYNSLEIDKKDILTNEYVFNFSTLNDFSFENTYKFLPYSIIKFDYSSEESSEITVNAKDFEGNVYLFSAN